MAHMSGTGVVQHHTRCFLHQAVAPFSVEAAPASIMRVPNSWLTNVQDFEVRLWDLRTMDCQGVLRCPGSPTAAYDPQVSMCGRLWGSHGQVRQTGRAHAPLPGPRGLTALQL